MTRLNELSRTDREYIMVEFTRGTSLDLIAWRVDLTVAEMTAELEHMEGFNEITLLKKYYGPDRLSTNNASHVVKWVRGEMWEMVHRVERDNAA